MRKKLLRGAAAFVVVVLILTVAFFSSREWIMWHVDFAIAQHRHRNLTTADFQYDFEHLMRVLEEDWPFFELSISANGVDVHQLADEFRYTLAKADVDAIGFFELLREDFFRPIGVLGHLWVMNYPMYFNRFHDIQYQRAHEEGEMAAFDELTPFTRHIGGLVRHLPTRIMYHRLRDAGVGSQPDMEEPVYETHILSNDTALLTVSRMLHLDADPVRRPGYQYMGYYEAMLYDFWYEIGDFDHLIIDLRGNGGGFRCHFALFVAPMLVTTRTWLPAYLFYGDGHYSNISRTVRRRNDTVDGIFSAIQEPVFHVDTGNLDFVFHSAASWLPASFYFAWRQQAFFARQWEPFAGKVWVLTDERTASAAEAVTAMLLLNNLATVVGQPTVGVIGTGIDVGSVEFALPNTGIIIRIDIAIYKCHEGNYLQGYGLQPHYAPRYGMDALETVLAMIAEGAY